MSLKSSNVLIQKTVICDSHRSMNHHHHSNVIIPTEQDLRLRRSIPKLRNYSNLTTTMLLSNWQYFNSEESNEFEYDGEVWTNFTDEKNILLNIDPQKVTV